MGNDEMKYYVWLQLCLGQGSKTFEHLLEDALLPSDIYSMTSSERKKVGYFSKGELDKMSKISIEDAVKIIQEAIDEYDNIFILSKSANIISTSEVL